MQFTDLSNPITDVKHHNIFGLPSIRFTINVSRFIEHYLYVHMEIILTE